MKQIFANDFTNRSLADWIVEQHVPDGYPDFVIRNGALAMLDTGNRLLPTIPNLRNFVLQGCFETDWHSNDNKFSLRIFFDYDTYKRRGGLVEFYSDGNDLFVSLHDRDSLIAEKKLDRKTLADIIRKRQVDFTVRANEKTVCLYLNSVRCFTRKVERIGGRIALSRGAFIGELRMKSFSIASNDKLTEQIIWDRLEIPFEPINGMDNSIIWTVSLRKINEIFRIDVELSGGCRSREDIKWFPYHCRYYEMLSSPYLRIESHNRKFELELTDKTLHLCQKPQKYFYLLGPEEPEWPFRKSFCTAPFDYENAVLFCGYRSYNCVSVNKHQAVGQCETAYDCNRKKIVYFGEAMESGTVAIDVKSPADKQICKAIPKSTHEYGKALRFARENHYFSESEECRFTFELISRIGDADTQLRVEYQLLNAFFEPLDKPGTTKFKGKAGIVVLDIEKRRSGEITFGKLQPGVYHLAFRLFQGGLLLQERSRAFEVYSETLSGAEASGLPRMFSMANEVMGLDTDYFDPWKPDCVDVSHYISIGTTIMPHFAREKRLWELYRLYHREWFLWFANRVMENWEVDKNRDLLENCDYVFFWNEIQEKGLVRPCCRAFYRGGLLEVLYEYALEHNFHPEKIKACIEVKTIPGIDIFNELVEKHFYRWIDFLNRRLADSTLRKKAGINNINPHARYAGYGAGSIYAAAYKTVHSTSFTNGPMPTEKTMDFYDGFLILEDYPHACRYNINRGPFLLASTKTKYPQWKIYPEMYTPFCEPCPDAAVARAWPSVGTWDENFPISCSIKRTLEYVYASVWHNGESFDYWRDYGLHTRIWKRERFEALLKIWGFIDKNRPVRPLKANAFICNEECCLNHQVFYDEYSGTGNDHSALGDLFNPAEECIAYAYEMSRNAGQNAGFVADFKSLDKLTAADIDILVLPPLTKVSCRDLNNIRQLHKQGVSLLAFEEIVGLEDLFGVKESKMCRVNTISVNETLPNNPLAVLSDLKEYTEHRACIGKYRATTAEVLLDGEIPVLFSNTTEWGRTALFNISPTAVRRQDQSNRVCYGRDSIGPLLNESMKLVLRYLSNSEIETDAGKIIAFKDVNGNAHIIIEEDAHPFPAQSIKPTLTLNIPGLKPENIRCKNAVMIDAADHNRIRLKLELAPDEFAIINLT